MLAGHLRARAGQQAGQHTAAFIFQPRGMAQVFNACADHIFISEIEQVNGRRVGNDCAAIDIEHDYAIRNAFQDGVAPAGLDPFTP